MSVSENLKLNFSGWDATATQGIGKMPQYTLVVRGNASPIDVPLSRRPYLAEVDSFISSEFWEIGGAEKVCAKLTDSQRSRLRITFMRPCFTRWR